MAADDPNGWRERFPYPEYLATVVRKVGGILEKGFVHNPELNAESSPAFGSAPLELFQERGCIFIEPGVIETIFFVRSLEGRSERHEVTFLDQSPGPVSLWVRAHCATSEILEGSTDNNLQLFTGRGFFLRPADSKSNNVLIFVMKSRLKALQVMGIQMVPKKGKKS